MLTEQTIADLIQVLPDGVIQVRTVKHIYSDGVMIASAEPHRYVLVPGDDVTDEDDRVKAVAEATWTDEVVTAYEAKIAALTP